MVKMTWLAPLAICAAISFPISAEEPLSEDENLVIEDEPIQNSPIDDGLSSQWSYDHHTLSPEEKPNDQEAPQQLDLEEDFSAYWQNIGLGLGTYSSFWGKVQDDDLGGTNGFELNPMIYTAISVHLSELFAWSPNFGVIILRNNEDSTINKQNFVFKSDFSLLWDTFIGVWHFGLSPGLFIERISGSGGQVTLNNGNTTENFYVPARSSLAYNFTAGAFIQNYFLPEWSLKAAADVFAPTESLERSMSFSFNLNWHYLGVQDFWE